MILFRNFSMCRRGSFHHLRHPVRKLRRALKISPDCCANLHVRRNLSLSMSCRTSEDIEMHPNLNGDFVSISKVKEKLVKSNYEIDEGYCCVSIKCLFCAEQSRVFINKVTGHFICYKCLRTGTWPQLESVLKEPGMSPHFGDTCSISAGAAAWEKLRKHLLPANEVDGEARKSVLSRLHIEGVPWSLLEQQGVMYDDKNGDLHWPLSLCSLGEAVPGYKTLSADDTEQCYPHVAASGVVRLPAKETATSAVLVPTLKDLLALSVHPPSDTDIICLPHGQFLLPQTLLPLLENYKKLVLWFGNDVTSWNNVRLFARKLSIERCYLVRPVKEHMSAIDAHRSNVNVAVAVQSAQAMSHSSIITFSQLRDDLATELYCSDQATGIKWTRFPALNSILQGHRRGELTILTGPTGSGKTTFMSEYSLDLAMQKVTTLWGSFEIRNQRLVRTMLQQMVCEPLQKNRDKFDEWADKFDLLPLYFMTFHGQQPLDAVLETVRHAAYVHDVAHVIIDNVQFMLGLSSSESGFLDRFYRQDALIGAFRNFATTYNCHVTLVIHPRKEREGESLSTSSIFGGAKASQEADNVLIIQHKFSNSGLKIKKYLQVAKNRFSGDLGIIPLEFDRDSLSFGAKHLQELVSSLRKLLSSSGSGSQSALPSSTFEDSIFHC